MSMNIERDNVEESMMNSSGRNDPCPCGSGKKYKKCCLASEEASRDEGTSFPLDKERVKEIIRSSQRFPVEQCLINHDWQKRGLANIIVTRRQEDGRFILGVYLVDLFCLGVKNAFCNAGVTRKDLDAHLAGCGPGVVLEPTDLDHAKEIIFGSMEYARGLGFEPHRDFKLAREVLGTDEVNRKRGVRFGGPGDKPLFISGPDDDADAILKKLAERN